MLREFNLIGANGQGSFPRHVRAEIHFNDVDSIAGRFLDLTEDHALEISSAQERFGQAVIAVIQGWGYRFKRLEIDGTFHLEKNWV